MIYFNNKLISGNGVQVKVVPDASASYANKIIQYIGSDQTTYKMGYFYRCKATSVTSEGEVVYTWTEIDVQALTKYYTKTEVDELINGVTGGGYVIVDELPTTDIKTNVFYLMKNATDPSYYDQYLYANDKWNVVGSTKMDTSQFVKKVDGYNLLADTDKANYDDAYANMHTHTNKDVLDKITAISTTFSDNPLDTDIPSEKLVKDTFDTYNVSTITDANTCIPELSHSKHYRLFAGYIPTNVPVVGTTAETSYDWDLTAINVAYDTTNYRLSQFCQSASSTDVYVRYAYSTDSGSTWNWGSWTKLLVATDIINRAYAPYGFYYRAGQMTWGKASQGTTLTDWGEDGGGDIDFFQLPDSSGNPDGKLYVQIDGVFYQNEGNSAVLDTSDWDAICNFDTSTLD